MYYQYQQEINDRVKGSLKQVNKSKGLRLQDTPEQDSFAYWLIRKWKSSFRYRYTR